MKKIHLIIFAACLILVANHRIYAQRFEDFKGYVIPGKGKVTSVKYNHAGTAFARGYSSGTVMFWEIANDDKKGIMPTELVGHKAEINHISFHPDEPYLITSDLAGVLNVWDLRTQKAIFTTTAKEVIKDGNKPIFTFAYFSIDKRAMVFGGSEGEVYVNRPLSNNTAPGIIAKHNAPLTCADYYSEGEEGDFSDGNYLALGSKGEVKILDYFTKKVLKVMKTCNGYVQDLRYNASGTEIGCLCDDGNFTVWNINTDEKVRSWFASPPGASTELSYSKDGNYLVIGDSKNTPKVFDAKTGKQLSVLFAHTQAVRSVDFHPSSKFILTGSDDAQVKVWKWVQTYENAVIPEPPKPIEPPKKPAPPVVPTPPVVVEKPKTAPTAELPPPVVANKPKTMLNNTPSINTHTRKAEEFDNALLENKLSVFDTVKLKLNARGIPDSLGDRRVTTGKKEFVRSTTIEVSVYDQEKEDGDMISLYFNGEWVLKEYTLKPIKRKITLTLNPDGDNHLVVYAHNLGTMPPNTVAVTVFDGKDERKLALSSSLRNSDSVNFKVNSK